MFKFIFVLFVFCGSTTVVFGMDCYNIARGDTLFEILERKALTLLLYNGRPSLIKQVIKLNPNIKNLDLIYPGDQICLQEKVNKNKTGEHKGSKTKKKTISDKKKMRPNLVIKDDRWVVGINYGIRTFDYTQTGNLGKASVGLFSFNNLNFYSTYNKKDFFVKLNFETYDIELNTTREFIKNKNQLLDLMVSYKYLSTGVTRSDFVVLKNDNGSILLTQLKLIKAKIGFQQYWNLYMLKNTTLFVNNYLSYPIHISSDDKRTSDHSVKGFDVEANVKIVRKVLESKLYAVYINAPASLLYSSLDHEMKWGSNSQISTNFLSFKMSLGFEVHF